MATITRSPRQLVMGPRNVASSLSEPMRRATKESIGWYLSDNPGRELTTFVKSLASSSTPRLYDTIRYYGLYTSSDVMSDLDCDGDAGRGDPSVADNNGPAMIDNQIRIQVDTTAGKLIQSNSRVTMLTNHGDFALWRKAMKCEAAIQGEWQRMGFYDRVQQVAKDGLTTGDGYVKFFLADDGKSIKCQRTFPNEIFVDNLEAAFSDPQKMYQMRYASRDKLMAQFPEASEVISRATSAQPPTFPWTMYSAGQIEIAEGWCLPCGERKGRHVIGCSAGTLLDEEWPFDEFPFVHFKPADMPMGYYGQGLVSQVETAQRSLNQMLNIMDEGATLAIAPFWIVAQGSNIDIRHLDNVPGTIVESTGADPKWITNAPFHQAAPVYCDLLRAIIKDQFGNNTIDTGGEPPINRIDSKRALREYQDQSSAHITLMIERWTKKVFTDAAKVTLMLAQQIAKRQGAYPVLVQQDYKRVIQLDWKELDLARDSYMLTPAPANLLSQTPAGKTQDLTEMMQSGLISQKQAQRMMLGPQDVNAMLEESTATEWDIDELIEGFLDRKAYRAPSSLQDLPRALVRVSDARLIARINGAPPDVLALFDRYLAAAEDYLQRMQQQPAPPADPNAQTLTDPNQGAINAPAAQPAAVGPGLALAPQQPPAVPAVGGAPSGISGPTG